MTSIEVICNGKKLYIELCEVWDFVRDLRSFQAHVVNKEAMQRHIIGKYKTIEIAEQRAKEWINGNKK